MAARRQPFDAPAADSLAGRVILVTGGGRGLGAAICASLARAGASVAVGDIDEDSARAVCERLPGGEEPLALPLDVRDERSARSAMREVVGRHGHIDALVNNAGVDVTKPVSGLSLDEWDRILAVNLRGPFLLSKLAFAEMQRRGSGGHIVNICSTAARRAWANASAYHASKWGLLGFSHALHVEGRAHGIKVTALIAGGMRTPFLLERFPDIDQEVLQDPASVAEAVRFVLTQPAGTVIPEIMVLPERETSWP